MTPQQIVEAIGLDKIATELGVKPALISNWKRRGFPAKYWHQIARLAGREMLGISLDAVAASSPKKGTRDVKTP